MRYPASEKAEIIQLVEGSHLPAKRTLDKLGIPRATFYRWHERYREGGPEALAGTAFPMLSVSRSSTWRLMFRNCHHESWRCASPISGSTSSRNPRCIACSRPMI
jgi:hypothetical protein